MYLIQFAQVFGCNISPYCEKVEILLKVLGMDYETIGDHKYLDRFSRHKFPVVQYNDQIIQDSTNIVTFLDKTVSAGSGGMDAGMTEQEIAAADLLRFSLENSLLPIVAYFRWLDEPGWQAWHKAVFAQIPALLKPIVLPKLQGAVRQRLLAIGTARYTESELLQQATELLHALHVQLGNKKFVFGDQFRTIDASVYGVLSTILVYPMDTPVRKIAAKYDNLVAYVKTVAEFAESNHKKALASRLKQ